MARQMEELTVVYRNESIRWDDVAIMVGDLVLSDAEKLEHREQRKPTGVVELKGSCEVDELHPLHTYRFYGHWKDYKNKRTGIITKQFHFQTFVKCQPHGRAGVINYLKTAPHIGQRTAEQLWEKFEGNAVRVLRETPEVAAAAVSSGSFGLKRAQEAASHLQTEKAMESCTIDLIDALSGRGFPKNTSRAAVKRWGNKAAQIIKRCPYYLMNFRGCGFLKTDAMYLDLGLPAGKLKRQALCAWHAVNSDNSGDVWYSIDFVEKALRARIGGAQVDGPAALLLAKKAKLIATRRDDQGKLWIAEFKAAQAELKVAESIACSELEEGIHWPDVTTLEGVSDHQREALASVLTKSIVTLGGAPGTGKTFTAAVLIKQIIAEAGSGSITVAAPTGKAAVRVTENLQRYEIETKARTIHSLLGVQKADDNGSGWSFQHNATNPLPYRFIIVDESSMIDNALKSSLLSARALGTHILYIGDINQLPPVGRGAPLRDLIHAQVPAAELTEIRRNSGAIVRACHAIKNGERIQPSRYIDLDAEDPENLYLVNAVTPQQQIEKTFDSIAAGQADGLDPIWDCQVLVGVNGKSPLSRKAMNKVLQERLNPNSQRAGNNPFRVGDKIVNLQNGFFEVDGVNGNDTSSPESEDIQTDDDGRVYVANGELAEVLIVEENVTVARLNNPTRIVRIPRGAVKEKDTNSKGSTKPEAESETATDSGCSWDLGYALSCHKSQGSEWPLVIVLLDEYPGAKSICTREWIYTAISRAKRLCLMVGKLATANAMVRRQALGKRKTFLAELISEERVKAASYLSDVKQNLKALEDQKPKQEMEVVEL